MRVILYTGKGGVGKTSVAAATALTCAKRGYKTGVMSTDAAHSLGDSFDVSLNGDMTQIADNLWAQEVDILKEVHTHWNVIQEWLVSLFRWQGVDDVIAEEIAILPGMEELMALLYISTHNREDRFDVLLVDCAPTGETLRLLSFPDMMRWYMRRLFPIQKRVAAVVRPLTSGILGLPTPGRAVFDSAEDLYLQLEEMRELLMDPDISSVRLVVNPEKMVIKEAQRTFTYLNLYGYSTDLIVCNRVLPEEASGEFLDNWRRAQAGYIDLVHEYFDPIPVLTAPFMPREVVGIEALLDMGGRIFDGDDPSRLFIKGKVQEVSSEGHLHVLRIRLPFARKEDISVVEDSGELVVQAGHYRRNILLPRALADLHVREATKEGDVLKVVFDDGADDEETETRR